MVCNTDDTQIDNTSPGGAQVGKLVPGSHKRYELGHTITTHFSRGYQRFREAIQVPDSLWKATTTFVRIVQSHQIYASALVDDYLF